MKEQEFIDRMRYICDEYFNDDEKMWDYLYGMFKIVFYRDYVWKLMNKKRWKKNVESVDKK